MADEEAVAKPSGGGGGKMLIIILSLLLVVVIGGAAAFYFIVMPKMTKADKAEPGTGQTEKAATAVATIGATSELDPFIVNLAGESQRYLKVTIVLQLSSEPLAKEISNRLPQIKDAVITVLSSKTPDDILTVQGKYNLKVEIMKRINILLTSGVVKDLYFVEFVVQ